MNDLYIKEIRTGKVFKVLSVAREDGKTLFLVWYDNYWKWLDVRKVEYFDTTWG